MTLFSCRIRFGSRSIFQRIEFGTNNPSSEWIPRERTQDKYAIQGITKYCGEYCIQGSKGLKCESCNKQYQAISGVKPLLDKPVQ